jgi:hypothetical protein
VAGVVLVIVVVVAIYFLVSAAISYFATTSPAIIEVIESVTVDASTFAVEPEIVSNLPAPSIVYNLPARIVDTGSSLIQSFDLTYFLLALKKVNLPNLPAPSFPNLDTIRETVRKKISTFRESGCK